MQMTNVEIITLNDPASGIPVEMTIKYFLTAAGCNAQKMMPLPALTQKLIDVATAHANALDVGYVRLLDFNAAWVLSRVSIEMSRYPGINEEYSITTWVENVNRRFSARNFMISGASGEVLGYARSIWVAIDIETRRPADLAPIVGNIIPSDRACPIEPFPRLAPIENPEKVAEHVFRFCDIDFNRHVNTTRYVEAILNQWSMNFYDRNRISRFDILFLAEAHFDDAVAIEIRTDSDARLADVAIIHDGIQCTRSRLMFTDINIQRHS